MRAGALRHKVVIEQEQLVANDYGEDVTTWVTFAEVFAQIMPLNGKEYFSSRQHQSQLSHKIRIRHIDGVNSKMRITKDARVFDIQSVINFQERGFWLEMMVTEDV